MKMTLEEWSAINGLQHWNSSAITMIEDAWRSADRAAREECAEICDDRAMECEIKTESESDEDEITELRSLAWQFAVLASRIRETISGG
jgi:DNA-binding LytR/AlgR family response regulator